MEVIMGKIKTHKASAKRFSVTAGTFDVGQHFTGLVKLNHMNRRHKLGKKTSKRKRQLRLRGYLSSAMAPTYKSIV